MSDKKAQLEGIAGAVCSSVAMFFMLPIVILLIGLLVAGLVVAFKMTGDKPATRVEEVRK